MRAPNGLAPRSFSSLAGLLFLGCLTSQAQNRVNRPGWIKDFNRDHPDLHFVMGSCHGQVSVDRAKQCAMGEARRQLRDVIGAQGGLVRNEHFETRWGAISDRGRTLFTVVHDGWVLMEYPRRPKQPLLAGPTVASAPSAIAASPGRPLQARRPLLAIRAAPSTPQRIRACLTEGLRRRGYAVIIVGSPPRGYAAVSARARQATVTINLALQNRLEGANSASGPRLRSELQLTLFDHRRRTNVATWNRSTEITELRQANAIICQRVVPSLLQGIADALSN
jgi:hypothetical protein